MNVNSKTLLFGAGAVIVVGGVLWWFFTSQKSSDDAVVKTSSQQTVTTTGTQGIELGKEANEILAAVGILSNLNLDTEFLNDSRFTSLKSTPVVIEPARPIPRQFDLSPEASLAPPGQKKP